MIDTLMYTRKLEEAGLTRDQAELMVRTQFNMISDNVATKNDLMNLKSDLIEKIALVDERLNSKIDGVEERLNSKSEGVEERLNSKIDGVEERLNSKINGVEQRLNSKIESSEQRLVIRLGSIVATGVGLLMAMNFWGA